MGEIDDTYGERNEQLEESYYEQLKKGKKRTSVLSAYDAQLKGAIQRYRKDYSRQLKKDKKQAGQVKKFELKKVNYEHLQVEGVSLEESSWEKFKRKRELFFFHLGRFVKKTFNKITPSFVLYGYYATKKALQRVYAVVYEFVEETLKDIGIFLLRLFLGMVRAFQWLFSKIKVFIKSIFGLLLFWRKKKKTDSKTPKDDASKEVQEKKESPS